MAYKQKGFDAGEGTNLKNKNKNQNQPASTTVKLQKRNMYPGDAVFEGSENSKSDQRITNNTTTGTKKSPTYTHKPEGDASVKTEISGKRKKVTKSKGGTNYGTQDASTEVTKTKRSGKTKTFKYDDKGNLVSKTKRDKDGNLIKSKNKSDLAQESKLRKKLRSKLQKQKDFSKKEKAALAKTKTKYTK